MECQGLQSLNVQFFEIIKQNQPIRLPGLILRLRSGQAPGVCSGLILSGAFYPDLKIGVWRRRTYQQKLISCLEDLGQTLNVEA